MKKGFKKYFGVSFLIGFGFLTMGMMEPLYDTYVPILLKTYIHEGTVHFDAFWRNVIMAIDNILALFMIPLVTGWSDRVHTKLGRRMPYIIFILPIAGITFGFLPIAATFSLLFLILIIGIHNVFKQTAYGPVVALMPDIVPADFRSEANGVINLMGGIGAAVASGLGGMLMKKVITLPGIGPRDNILAFPVVGISILVATIVLIIFVREKRRAESEEAPPILKSIKEVFTKKDKSALFILLGIACWFFAYEGVKPNIGIFMQDIIKVPKGHEIFGMAAFIAAYIIFAIPSGILGHKYGRKKVIQISILGCTIVMAGLFIAFGLIMPIYNSAAIGEVVLIALMFLFGAFWIPIITNSFPMLWQMSSFINVGIFTGLYYTFKQVASILAPMTSGLVIDIFGYPGMFLFALIFLVGAYLIMRKVKHGDAEEPTEEAELPA